VETTPLAVAAGETDPHGAAGHDTVQVTPWFAESLATVAVTCTEPPACTVDGFSATETVMGDWLLTPLELLPPQPAMAIVRTSCSNTTEENVERFTTPPCGQPEFKRTVLGATPNKRHRTKECLSCPGLRIKGPVKRPTARLRGKMKPCNKRPLFSDRIDWKVNSQWKPEALCLLIWESNPGQKQCAARRILVPRLVHRQ
jgi:hypothetical protein